MFKSKLKTMIDGLIVCGYGKTNEPCDVTADGNDLIALNN